MNCDQVFDVLTRGPFPNGDANDASVEAHLGHCDACRRLAAALQPAIELFEEAVAPEESLRLPAYWGDAFDTPADASEIDAPDVAGRSAIGTRLRAGNRVALPVHHVQRNWRGPYIARVAAGLFLCAVLAGALGRWKAEPERGAVIDEARLQATVQWSLDVLTSCDRGEVPNSQELAAAVTNISLVASELSGISCCTDCHGKHQPHGLDATARAGLARSCRLCHSETSQR